MWPSKSQRKKYEEKEFVSGKNPTAKAIYEECVDNVQLWELSKEEVK